MTQNKQEQGLIAILDALGAATYDRARISRFLESRQLVIDQLVSKTARLGIEPRLVTTFTFGDTILIVYRTTTNPTLRDWRGFGELIRRFQVNSLELGIFFRGAIAVGSFQVIEANTNTVMGDAVSDAAAWYDRTEWIGIAATPHATLYLQSLIEQGGEDIQRLMVDYEVPLKDGRCLPLKAVNWPKAFYVKGMTPCAAGENKRAKCLALLTTDGVPVNTEQKYFNTMKFFDHCAKVWQEEQSVKKRGGRL